MNVFLTCSEAVPFGKTGGLADVSSALARALDDLGHAVTLILPHYPQLLPKDAKQNFCIEPKGDPFKIKIGPRETEGRFLRACLPDSNVEVLLVDQPEYFDRPSPYVFEQIPYEDNCERFVFLSRAVIKACEMFGTPDVIHANDWQTGLVPALVDLESRKQMGSNPIASVFTIHNLAFQGRFWHWDMVLTGLDWKYFNWKQMEFFGDLNLLKTGIVFADRVTTVSPTYAEEIQTPEFGWGMESTLKNRRRDLSGILNGVDVSVWSPEHDPHLKKNYSFETVKEGKAACKFDLQETLDLPTRQDVPIIGIISRLTDQKGFDLIEELENELLVRDMQLVVLGTGDIKYERLLTKWKSKAPNKVAAIIDFDEELAHKIEAGADAFLMPSSFEPCGLNQMYSMLYGTLPITHRVGGLADSIVNLTPETLTQGTANGFDFQQYSSRELLKCIDRMLETYRKPDTWNAMQMAGMRHDWSWRASALKYADLYQQALDQRGRQAR